MAFAWLMNSGENCVYNANRRSASKTSDGYSIAGTQVTISGCCRLKGADYGRSNGDDAPVVELRLRNCGGGLFGNPIRLVEGKTKIESRITRR
jgi:hypothetical protein